MGGKQGGLPPRHPSARARNLFGSPSVHGGTKGGFFGAEVANPAGIRFKAENPIFQPFSISALSAFLPCGRWVRNTGSFFRRAGSLTPPEFPPRHASPFSSPPRHASPRARNLQRPREASSACFLACSGSFFSFPLSDFSFSPVPHPQALAFGTDRPAQVKTAQDLTHCNGNEGESPFLFGFGREC